MTELDEALNAVLETVVKNVENLLSKPGWHERVDGSLEFEDTGVIVRQSGYDEMAVIYSWDEGRITYEGNVVNRLGGK